ncbi:hypothetical protein [Sphingomicrobium aestuariivivum]|uniref:hypothetical protein n=1 Tax=Sphingomicrobium aestuariivivum TaxID=1582356 RepID=UPI001FD658DB|nr:hypothetical protein [Sphingomicrobium aestuariivivum]MCJ8190861.1 hypothetical protein [Sphingomicrobium aestuariivivum]
MIRAVIGIFALALVGSLFWGVIEHLAAAAFVGGLLLLGILPVSALFFARVIYGKAEQREGDADAQYAKLQYKLHLAEQARAARERGESWTPPKGWDR